MDDSLAATLRTRLAQALTSPWASEAVTDWSALSLGNAEVPQGAAEQASPMLASVGQLAPPSPLAAATAGESVPGAPTGPGGGAGGAAATHKASQRPRAVGRRVVERAAGEEAGVAAQEAIVSVLIYVASTFVALVLLSRVLLAS